MKMKKIIFFIHFAFCSSTKDVNDWLHEQQDNDATLVLTGQLNFQYSQCPKSPLSHLSPISPIHDCVLQYLIAVRHHYTPNDDQSVINLFKQTFWV